MNKQKQREVGICEFKANLTYRENSGTARATQKLCLNNQKERVRKEEGGNGT